MPTLFENAVEAIQLGVEDYLANDARRSSSAARNYFAGLLLLSKEALTRSAPQADAALLISARLRLVPDGHGGASVEPQGHSTADFDTLADRLSSFGVPVDLRTLRDLQRIRNAIEHSQHSHTWQQVREAISHSFHVVAQLLEFMGEEPLECLGDAWSVMLEVGQVFERELETCRNSFNHIDWPLPGSEIIQLSCPECGSLLIMQANYENKNLEDVEARCRACGHLPDPEQLLEHSLYQEFSNDIYASARYGGEAPLYDCPECGLNTYLSVDELVGCTWCGEVLGSCAVCGQGLTPDTVSGDNSGLCSYHGSLANRDD